MATALKKTRLHELDSYAGTPQGGVLLYSKDNKEYKIDAENVFSFSNPLQEENLSR